MRINLGSGTKRYDGFLNIDSSDYCNPDILLDLNDKTMKLPFEDSSVEVVLAEHILEHIGEGYFNLIQEIYRVCKHGAEIYVKVPHPRHDIFIIDPTHVRPITAEGLAMFSQRRNHQMADQHESALGLIYGVDFEVVESHFIPDPRYVEVLNSFQNEQERLNFTSERNNVIMEIHIKMVVIKDELK